MVLIATFAVLVLLRYAAVLFLAMLIVRPVSACPACFDTGTIPVRSRWLQPFSRHYEMRWCARCGWQAVVKRGSSAGHGRSTTVRIDPSR